MIKSKLLKEHSNIVHGFGNRHDIVVSSDNIHFDDLNIKHENWIESEQVHGNSVVQIDKQKKIISGADGMICANIEKILTIRTADCVPVLFYDPINKCIGAVHSGREGTRLNIVESCLNLMSQKYNTVPKDLLVAIGPAISAKNYIVDDVCFKTFIADTGIVQSFNKIDLRLVIREQLISCGVVESGIDEISECTYENLDYNSYRRDRTKQRQISYIGILYGE